MTHKTVSASKGLISRRTLLFSIPGLALVPAQVQARAARRPEVHLLRGFADIFSTGIDEIGAALQVNGIDAQVKNHIAWRLVANTIIADRQKYGPQPVILIGHSLGANAIISIAEVLEKQGIPVNYAASFAATAPDPLPGNIRRIVNFYFSQNGWGRALVPGPRFRGKLENRDFAAMKDVGHFNIDKQRSLQAEVVRDVLRIVK